MKRLLCKLGVHRWFVARVWQRESASLVNRCGYEGWVVYECARCGERHRGWLGNHPPIPRRPASEGDCNISRESYDFEHRQGEFA